MDANASFTQHRWHTDGMNVMPIKLIYIIITVGNCVFPVVGSRLWNSLPPDITSAPTPTVFGTASKLTSLADHFLPNCFQLLVLYTVYSSGLAVLYLGHSKYL